MAEVEILLATYNGEKYLKTQLDSILRQTFQGFQIIIRDDGSTDRTIDIIKDYEVRYPDKIRLVSDDATCGNPTSNFLQLVKYATADYIMFSDQDDYWLSDKVEISLQEIKKIENFERERDSSVGFCSVRISRRFAEQPASDFST